MKIKITLFLGLLTLVSTVFAQTITTKKVEVIETDKTLIEGDTKILGKLKVEGPSADGAGRLDLISNLPKIIFTENDQSSTKYTVQLGGSQLEFIRRNLNQGINEYPIRIGDAGEGTTFEYGVTLKDGFLAMPAEQQKTINTDGKIWITSSRVVVDTYSNADEDDLTFIGWGNSMTPVDGALLYLRTKDSTRDVLIKHNGTNGNIKSSTYSDEFLTTKNEVAILMFIAATGQWHHINAR